MKRILWMILSLALLSACDKDPVAEADDAVIARASALDGAWISNDSGIESADLTVKVIYFFEGNTVTARTDCAIPGQKVTVSVSTLATITQSEITLTGDRQVQVLKMKNGFDCLATLGATTAKYLLTGDNLRLETDDQWSQLTRL